MAMNRTEIYDAIKISAKSRDWCYELMSESRHPDTVLTHNFNNRIVNQLIAEYKEAGGRRSVEKFQKEDR